MTLLPQAGHNGLRIAGVPHAAKNAESKSIKASAWMLGCGTVDLVADLWTEVSSLQFMIAHGPVTDACVTVCMV